MADSLVGSDSEVGSESNSMAGPGSTLSVWKFNPSDRTIALTKLLMKHANLC